MPNIGPTELLIVLVIVVILFGAGRISRRGRRDGRGCLQLPPRPAQGRRRRRRGAAGRYLTF